jgi:hypothetical protein
MERRFAAAASTFVRDQPGREAHRLAHHKAAFGGGIGFLELTQWDWIGQVVAAMKELWGAAVTPPSTSDAPDSPERPSRRHRSG